MVSQVQIRVPFPDSVPSGWYPRVASRLHVPSLDRSVVVTPDELIVASQSTSTPQVLELVSDVAAVLPRQVAVASLVHDEDDPGFIDVMAVSGVDRLCELDVAASVFGWSRHVTWPARVVSSSVDGSAVLARYAHVAARLVGSLADFGIEVSAEEWEAWATEACEDGEWRLMVSALSDSVCRVGLRDAFDEGERVEVSLVSSTLRALACGALWRRSVALDADLSQVVHEMMSGRI